MKYAVLGAGAMGSVVGGCLARGGLDVTLWDVNMAHVDAINARGLRLDLPDGQQRIAVPACHPEDGNQADAILVLTKTLHTENALASVRRQIDQGAHVIGLQNGLGNERIMARHVPPDQLSIGCTRMPGRFLAPGHVASQGAGSAVFRAVTPQGAATSAGHAVRVPGFVLEHDQSGTDTIIWQKAAFNCAMNAILAVNGGTVGHLADSRDGVSLAYETAKEVVTLAKAQGVNAEFDAVCAHIDRSLANHREHKPSMLQDIEAGRPTEIDALCGEVARQAETLGLETPINKTLAVLVRLKSHTHKDIAA